MTDHSVEPHHPKQDFQVERIAFFSDAVFAIALTLLIIEFKPPIITKTTTAKELWDSLDELKYKGIALVASFTLIISFWMRHHTLFKYIHNYNKPIIATNMALLLPIIFFPFTTAFLYESVNSHNGLMMIPVRAYFFVTVLACMAMYVLYYLVIKKYPECSYPMQEKDKREFDYRLLLMIISFSLLIIISFFSSKYMYFGILPLAVYNFYDNYIRKFREKRKQSAIKKRPLTKAKK